MGFESVLTSLGNRDLITPYFESAILSGRWPDSYTIEVDSRPYYGAGDGFFHPSTHPMMSERQLYYIFHPDYAGQLVWERTFLKREMWLSIGSALHAVLQTQMQMCGLIRDESEIEREYIISEHHVRGRIDWIVTHPNGQIFPVEYKTNNSWDFRRLEEPKPEWLAQINLALDALDMDFGVLLIAERGGGFDMREFHVKRNRQLLDEIYGKFDRVRAALAAGDPPIGRCCAVDTPEMQSCPARHICYGRC